MIYKRGKFHWYRFMWDGKLIRKSTRQGNGQVARNMESAHRTSLAKGEVGIRDKKIAPTLAEFASKRFLPWVEISSSGSVKTWLYYRNGVRRLSEFTGMAGAKLDEIGGTQIAAYVAARQSAGLQVSSINRELQVLRRILAVALEWGAVERVSKVKLLSGERHRERVVNADEEARYLSAATEPLTSIASVLVDSGLRPEECFRLQWENVWFGSGRYGALFVPFGKTQAARRTVPLTPRARAVLEARWVQAKQPAEGWVWPAPTRSGHVESSSLKKQHTKALRLSGARAFVLYSLRHTFLTRLGESGCDAWTLARIAGHSSIGISSRYVHPGEDAVLAAMSRMGGHKIEHSEEMPVVTDDTPKQLTH
jgi:integrase